METPVDKNGNRRRPQTWVCLQTAYMTPGLHGRNYLLINNQLTLHDGPVLRINNVSCLCTIVFGDERDRRQTKTALASTDASSQCVGIEGSAQRGIPPPCNWLFPLLPNWLKPKPKPIWDPGQGLLERPEFPKFEESQFAARSHL